MNEKGIAPLVVPLIIAGAILLGSFIVAYKPHFTGNIGVELSQMEVSTGTLVAKAALANLQEEK